MNVRRLTARCILVALAPLTLDGCLSIGVDKYAAQTPAAGALCSFEARLYEKEKDVKRDAKSAREVTWKLFNLDTSPVVPVKEGAGTTWSATDLKAGEYRLAASWGPKPGVPGDTSAGTGDKTFTLAPGENARANVVLSEFPGWAWAVIAVVIAAAAVVAIVGAIVVHAENSATFIFEPVRTSDRAPAAGRVKSKDAVERAVTD